jgi:hypothetical protein
LALLRVKRIRALEEPGQIRSRKIRYYERQWYVKTDMKNEKR